jgi:predicted dehydrogenase
VAHSSPGTGLDAWFEQGHVQGRFTHAPDGPPQASVVTTRHGDEPASDTDLGSDPVVAECRHFADVVTGRAAASLLDAAEAVQSLRVLDALRASIMQRAWADVVGG